MHTIDSQDYVGLQTCNLRLAPQQPSAYSGLDMDQRMDAEAEMRRRDREEGRDVGRMRRGLPFVDDMSDDEDEHVPRAKRRRGDRAVEGDDEEEEVRVYMCFCYNFYRVVGV